jgi:hypothetical protein
LFKGPPPKRKTLANEALKQYVRPRPRDTFDSEDSDFDIPTNRAQRKSSVKGVIKRTRGQRTAIKHLSAASQLLLRVMKKQSDNLGKWLKILKMVAKNVILFFRPEM